MPRVVLWWIRVRPGVTHTHTHLHTFNRKILIRNGHSRIQHYEDGKETQQQKSLKRGQTYYCSHSTWDDHSQVRWDISLLIVVVEILYGAARMFYKVANRIPSVLSNSGKFTNKTKFKKWYIFALQLGIIRIEQCCVYGRQFRKLKLQNWKWTWMKSTLCQK